VPLLIVEGEFKCLAAADLARHQSTTPRFAVIGLSGCWGWTGRIGKAPGPNGDRRDVKGVIPDFDRVIWKDRKVLIAFDSDSQVNSQVRAGLARELRSRGACVAFLEWDPAAKGIDDWIHAAGPDAVLTAIAGVSEFKGWRENLICTTAKKTGVKTPKGCLANAITALREAPEWRGVLRFDEFSLLIEARTDTPFSGPIERWGDQQDRLTANWLQHAGIFVESKLAGQAVETVATENPFHPMRDYLNSLTWDRVGRLDVWLNKYLGVAASDYAAAVGSRFLISAAARILRPGVKSDHVLVLESEQGAGKSQAARVLFEPWFCDYLPDLGTKDEYLQLAGVWGVEISELAALQRSSIEKIKNFLAGQDDRYRLPYGHRPIDIKRQNVFVGTTNSYSLPPDETGNRRFWPVRCNRIDLKSLRADRKQLWAEAVARLNAGATWWLDTHLN
jgi:hypothetical protein